MALSSLVIDAASGVINKLSRVQVCVHASSEDACAYRVGERASWTCCRLTFHALFQEYTIKAARLGQTFRQLPFLLPSQKGQPSHSRSLLNDAGLQARREERAARAGQSKREQRARRSELAAARNESSSNDEAEADMKTSVAEEDDMIKVPPPPRPSGGESHRQAWTHAFVRALEAAGRQCTDACGAELEIAT